VATSSVPRVMQPYGAARPKPRWLVIAGAVSSYTWDLFRCLAEVHQIDLRVVHRRPAKALPHETYDARDVSSCDLASASLAELVRFMEIRAADAILLYGTVLRSAVAMAMIHKRATTPVVLTGDTNVQQVFPRTGQDWLRMGWYRLLSHGITEGWTLGRSNEDAFRLFGVRQLRPLPFAPVQFADFDVSSRQRPAFADDRRIYNLLTVARLAPEKNHSALLDAIALPEIRHRVHLTIVGDGPSRPSLETQATRLGLENTTFVGARNHEKLGPFFANADAFVLPSVSEPWGIVVIEALGLGIPVLGTPSVGAAVSMAGIHPAVRLARGTTSGDLCAAIRSILGEAPELAIGAERQAAAIRDEYGLEPVARRMVVSVNQLRQQIADERV
jgi:glycosyltransferase involved in cell wall biosynthesis